jgi:SAM-dependent methyltransferase
MRSDARLGLAPNRLKADHSDVPSSLPDAPATARNREPILAILREQFAACRRVLEIGSGTGQHAVYFGAALPHLSWQTSDLPEHHAGIHAWIAASQPSNVLPPLELDAGRPETWPDRCFDAVFSANTLHIMGWPEVESLFANLPRVLEADARLVIYGPFNVDGKFTAPSNETFDAQLRAADSRRGIRDLEAVQALAADVGLIPVADVPMPANNRCVVWRYSPR